MAEWLRDEVFSDLIGEVISDFEKRCNDLREERGDSLTVSELWEIRSNAFFRGFEKVTMASDDELRFKDDQLGKFAFRLKEDLDNSLLQYVL